MHDLPPDSTAEYQAQVAAAITELEQLTPAEIVAMSRRPGLPNELLGKLHDAAFEELPMHNLPFGRAVYTAFADSEYVEDRRFVSNAVNFLTKADHASGVALWNRLARDPDWWVRDIAMELIREAASDAKRADNPDDLLRKSTGLTWYDAFLLHQAYVAAEQGHDLYRPDRGRLQASEVTQSPAPPVGPRRFLGSVALARWFGLR